MTRIQGGLESASLGISDQDAWWPKMHKCWCRPRSLPDSIAHHHIYIFVFKKNIYTFIEFIGV